MTTVFGFLRGRLLAWMALLCALGLAGAFISARLGLVGDVAGQAARLPEPYQDLALVIPLTLGAALVTWAVVGRGLGRLHAATQDAATIGPDNLSTRLSSAGLPGEVLPFVQAVNAAIDRLADAYAAEQRFIGDAAHQMQTPLAALSLRLQVAQIQGAAVDWAAIDGEVRQLSRLLDQLLDLARHEAGRLDAARDFADLQEVCRRAVAQVSAQAEAAGRPVDLVTSSPDRVLVRGRGFALEQAIVNLLENGLTHGSGRVRLSLATEASMVLVTVEDEGPGFSSDFAPHAFERFRKGALRSSGHGLGLAIVRQIVSAAGGTVRVRSGSRPEWM